MDEIKWLNMPDYSNWKIFFQQSRLAAQFSIHEMDENKKMREICLKTFLNLSFFSENKTF